MFQCPKEYTTETSQKITAGTSLYNVSTYVYIN